MRVTLNLATRPFRDLGPGMRRLRIAMGVLAGLLLLLLLGLHALHRKAEEARAREHSLDGAIARIAGERAGYQTMMQRPENARFMEQVTDLNQLFDEKAFSWTLAMENLETVLPGGVEVTQIEPERAKDGHITLHLRVVGPHDLVDNLVSNLEHSRRFLSPRIVGESAASSTSGNNRQLEPVSISNQFEFELQAEYMPPLPEERAARNPNQEPAAASANSGAGPAAAPGVAKAPRQAHTGPGVAAAPGRPGPVAPPPPPQGGSR